ncbi:Prenyltrans domain-containing protein/Prenyltrans_2 domain-containing protein [Cephalotus follicularis]|uniref:Protein farnesyltransferase subunit beta n=1 Tax=Cephalotus follicularis TaxID=3775 RepID=A0A1Q3C323_CEPFO|nr:Prenyltrans domain-containing protein/Prenyltrans_2 domain-containing protein [Cephalotus follicularis]
MESATITTVSEREQWMVQNKFFQIYDLFLNIPHNAQSLMLEIQRDNHMEYLTKGLKQLGPSFCVLDANRPWLCYWILHAIAILGDSVDGDLEYNAIDFLNRCQDPDGGYAGGPGQMPHLATTYAAVNSLITLGGDRSLSSINRGKLHMFLRRMKDPSGAFRMHDKGESDVRACYTAISVASVLNILDDELVQNVGNYILSCQTYEGGIAGEPGSEAHGGYTFCGLATMILVNEVNRLDLAALIEWVVFRQGVEGGFQGRTNKLVDGCYSFWQGGIFALLQRLDFAKPLVLSYAGEGYHDSDSSQTTEASDISEEEESLNLTLSHVTCHSKQRGPQNFNDVGYSFIKGHVEIGPLFQSMALQQYILLCSQEQQGGLRDKPGKPRDYYHTCYCLSGLSVCQHIWSEDKGSPPLPRAVMGPYSNLLEPIHPLFNLVLDRYHEAHEFFSRS